MNSLIRTYNDFIEQLKEEYAARGFQIVPSREVSTQLNFKPDLVVRRGNEVTIVEVKTSGRISAGQLTEMRRQAENLGYRFELKVLPRAPRKSVRPDEGRVLSLLADARKFYRMKRYDLALLSAWIAIEISMRVLTVREIKEDAEPLITSGDFIRAAIELEIISEADLPIMRAIGELRNRIVHGFETEIPSDLVNHAIEIASNIAGRADLGAQ